jgi:hypothetical protein
VALIVLTSRLGVIKAALDHILRLTRGILEAIRPSHCTNGLIILYIIDKVLDIDLHCWISVRDCRMGWRQYTPSSNLTTPESNMSDYS